MDVDTPIEKIIYMLEIARYHEGMIFGTNDIDRIVSSFNIMHMVCRAFDVHFEQQCFQASVEAHGWIYTNQSPAQQMRDKGYTYHQILNTLLDIEVDTWARSNMISNERVDALRAFAKQAVPHEDHVSE
jgi:hypothetical protein